MSINIKSSLISKIIQVAQTSFVKNSKMAAAIINGTKLTGNIYANTGQQYFNGIDIGSTHAELHAIKGYYGNQLSLNKKKGWIISNNKKTKLNLFVIKIDNNSKLSNSRPCINCLNIMKQIGIKKVYYSVSNDKIICENVKNMISIHISSTFKIMNKIKNTTAYYNYLLQKNIPTVIRKYNLECFINYSFSNILPLYKILIYKHSLISCIYFLNEIDEIVVSSKLIL